MFGWLKKRNAAPQLDRSQIVPRIKNTKFIAALREAGVPEDQLPATEPLVADLVVTYAFDLPDSFMMATPQLIADAGVDSSELRELAVANLRSQISEISLRQSGSGLVYNAATGENRDACVLLSQSYWENQSAKLEGQLIACVPNRDIVLFCDSTSEDGLREMEGVKQEAFDAGENHALTLSLIKWTEAGWQSYEG